MSNSMTEPTEPTTESKLKRYGIPGALVVGGIAVGSLFAPIGLASAQETDAGDENQADTDVSGSDGDVDADGDNGAEMKSERDGRRRGHKRGHRHGERLELLTELLDTDAEALRSAFADGSSLADIAEDAGIDLTQVKAALTAAAEERLAAAVEAGRLSQDEADAKLAEMTLGLDEKLNSVPSLDRSGHSQGHRHKGFAGRKGAGGGEHRAEMSEFLGLSGSEIRQGLADGKTIADLAAEQGIGEDELVDHIVSNIETRVNEAVEAGKLDADTAAEKLEQVEDHVSNMVNGELPSVDGKRAFPGKRGMSGAADRFQKGANGA